MNGPVTGPFFFQAVASRSASPRRARFRIQSVKQLASFPDLRNGFAYARGRGWSLALVGQGQGRQHPKTSLLMTTPLQLSPTKGPTKGESRAHRVATSFQTHLRFPAARMHPG